MTFVKFMKILLSLKVISESVGSALQFTDKEDTQETYKLIMVMDLFFDSLNVLKSKR